MTDTAMTDTTEAPGPGDPRSALAAIVDAVGTLMEQTTPDMIGNPTPCDDFTVKELLEHIVHAVQKLAGLGRGNEWTLSEPQATDSGWAQDYRTAAHDLMLAWTDPATLEMTVEVPWGTFPGAVLLHSYAGEFAVHGWDLSQATGVPFTLDDDLLQGALVAAKFIPTEGRDDPDMPFGAIVDPGEDAPVLLQLAGWMGREVA